MKITLEQVKETLGVLLLSCEGEIPEEFPVSITNDSRTAGSDSVFVAIKGSAVDGHNYIDSAVNSGCKIVVCETVPGTIEGVLCLRVKDSYSAYALLAELYAGNPSEKLTLVGVTGTNGKTTTAYLIKSILNQSSLCGLISTVEYATGKSIIPAMRTTPDALELQGMYSEMNDSGCDFAVMEVSSHALDQNRIGSAKFAVAVFTNLTGDHLDYHKNMDSYFNAKKVLFENHIAENGTALINIDDPFGKRLYDSVSSDRQAYSFGMDEKADFRIENLYFSIDKTEFALKLPDSNSIKLSSPLCGKFNAYNITSAAATAYLLKVEPEIIIKGISEMASVPGRMDRCSENPVVFVDYAHTDDALENVLSTVSEFLLDRNLTVVFGCGGDRDRSKRPRMGAVAAKLADKIIVTSDNPRSEDPNQIIEEITTGIPDDIQYDVIPDRKQAIRQAIETADPNDVIVIAGKGHEDYQEINGVKHHFDDREVVRELIVNS